MNYPDALAELRATSATPENMVQTLQLISKSLFVANFNWGHVVAVLFLSGELAVHAVESSDRPAEAVEQIIWWLSVFFDSPTFACWIANNGGWETLVKWKNASTGNLIADWVTVSAAMSVGVLAACLGFGALLLSRK